MTADTDKELINQLRNLKTEIIERLRELENRGHEVVIESSGSSFAILITKTVTVEEEI